MSQIVLITVQNKAGVLNKITSLCRRRKYNIDSLTVGKTENIDISHITMVFAEDKEKINQIINQIDNLIEVIDIEVVESRNVVDKELVLLIIKKNASNRIAKITDRTNADLKIINNFDRKQVIQIVGEGVEIENIIEKINKKDIIRIVRSGLVVVKI